MGVGMARKPKKLPDYFTAEEARALVAAAPSYPTRMAMRIMLRTGLRVSECLSLCAADLRLSQDPPIISLRPEVTGNKSKRGREVPGCPVPGVVGIAEVPGGGALMSLRVVGCPGRVEPRHFPAWGQDDGVRGQVRADLLEVLCFHSHRAPLGEVGGR